MIKDEIISAIEKALKELGFEEKIEIKLEPSSDLRYGDYTSNIAMKMFQKVPRVSRASQVSRGWSSPMELGEKIVGNWKLEIGNLKFLERVEAVKPGFINFWLSDEYLLKNLSEVLEQKDKFGRGLKFSEQKIMVEFAHPNTHKEFHIGHLRNIVIGEAICRILKAQSAEIFRANYQGDIGLHVAKAIFGIFQLCHAEFSSASQISDNKILKQVQDDNLKDKIRFLAEAYIAGNKAYEEDEKAKEQILEINKSLYSKEEKYREIWEKSKKWSLDYFDLIYKRLGSYFDQLFLESEVYEKGKEIVKNNVKNGIFTEDQGAIIFDPEKAGVMDKGLHKRVFITGEGNATYEGKEMGLALLEYSAFPFDLNVHVVAHEQAGYFRVVFKALELIDKKFKDKQKHLSYGMVELKEGKMSSRMGNIITAEWLLDEAKSKIRQSFPRMDEETAEEVAVGAVKYSLLKFSVAANVSFSFDESISLEGNSGPYLQYTFARTQSVIAKSQISNLKSQINSKSQISNSKLEPEEEALLRLIQRFTEVVESAAGNFAPNLLTNYLFDLSQRFNLFYQKHKVIGSENEEFRLGLVAAVGQILKNGLYLLGIEAPERM